MLSCTFDSFLGIQNLAFNLLLALQALPAPRLLCSSSGGKNLLSDLSRLNSILSSDLFDNEHNEPLLRAVLSNEPDDVIWDKAYAAVTETTPPPPPLSSSQQP